MDWEWASDALNGQAHRSGGLRGVAWLNGMFIAAGVWLWVRLGWAAGGDFLLCCFMMPAMATTASLHWLARPHLLGWLWLMLTLWAAERAGARFGWRHGLAAAGLGALWANTHPSFVIGAAVLLLHAAGTLLARLLWKRVSTGTVRWYLAALGCGLAGTLANPYGWALHAHVAAYLTNRDLLARVAEFQTFNFHAEGAFWPTLVLALTATGAALALGQRHVGRGLVLLFFSFVALRSARGLPLAAMAALPLANGAITLALCRAEGLRGWIEKSASAFLRYSANLRRIDAGLGGWLWAPAAAAAAWFALGIPAVARATGFPPSEFPVAMAAKVETLESGARLYAPDKFGGYLIYRFNGRRKVFFDGRSDFYGSDFMKRYLRLSEARPGWQRDLAGHGITHALVAADSTLDAAMRSAGWEPLGRDKVAALYRAPRESK
jgi:hypothetical protein